MSTSLRSPGTPSIHLEQVQRWRAEANVGSSKSGASTGGVPHQVVYADEESDHVDVKTSPPSMAALERAKASSQCGAISTNKVFHLTYDQ